MDERNFSRRKLIWAALISAFGGVPRIAGAQSGEIGWSYPMGIEGGFPGEGCGIFHGYACENIPWFPGLWHTGENWHLIEGESGGTPVLAAADGEVVYAGSDYPGLVAIIQHAGGLFSMYGHLNFGDAVVEGQMVSRGERIGNVLTRTDGRLSHLHFEIRTFLMASEVNGDAPRHTFNCGYECPPGPGYWPMSDSDHPSVMGWRNPTSVIGTGALPENAEAVVTPVAGSRLLVWSGSKNREGSISLGEMDVKPGDRLRVFEIDAGDPESTETSAGGYHLWYRITQDFETDLWVQAAVSSSRFTGSDGRPSSVRLRLIPDW